MHTALRCSATGQDVPTYKAQREEAPDILRQQIGLVRQVCEVLKITMLELPGADPILLYEPTHPTAHDL